MSKKSELEVVIYSKITNFDGLQKASKIEEHEQCETEFINGIRCRVRRTNTLEDPNSFIYEFTYKTKKQIVESDSPEAYEDNIENTAEVDADFYEGLKYTVDRYLLKTRYVFASSKIILSYNDENNESHDLEVPNVEYEVDVYKDKNGEICEWCKIDVELDAILDYLNANYPDLDSDMKFIVKISHLPFMPVDSIIMSSATEEQKQFVKELWDNHYLLPPMRAR